MYVVGAVHETVALPEGELTAIENVRFGAEAAGRREAGTIARRTLVDVGLGDRFDHFPHELSGGEQQRVAIARALATGNPVLLADEPTGELDFRTGAQVLSLLQARVAHGTTVLVVSGRDPGPLLPVLRRLDASGYPVDYVALGPLATAAAARVRGAGLVARLATLSPDWKTSDALVLAG